MWLYKIYKNKVHFPLNFYGIFLLVTFIPDIIGLPSSLITNGLWLLKVLLCSWIIFKHHKKIYQLNWQEKLYIFVAFVYFLNIFIDVFWSTYPMAFGKPMDLFVFFLSILIALSFRFDPAFYSNPSFQIFLFTLSLGLFIAFFLAKESPPPLVGRYDANSVVNSINYGQMGCSLSIIALYGYFNKPFKYSKVIYPFLFILGIVSIMKAGSRSPVVVLILVSTFYFFAKSGFMKGLLVISGTSLLLWFSLGFIIEIAEALGSSIVTRLISAAETGETSGRDAIYANAISLFEKNPLFGHYYLISSGVGKGGYPHNFFIEAFMTTGLVGGVPFVGIIILAVYKSFKFLKLGHTSGWIILLFLQVLVYGMFSSSLYSSQDFWALCFFIISMPASILNNKRKFLKITTSSTAKQPSLGFS